MNFIDDVIQRLPFGKVALVAIDAAGKRRVWHFSELFAMSAGLSGALAARGVHREDVVMTMLGSRVEWVIAMLACFRMGAVAMPCNPQLRRRDIELRIAAADPVLCIAEERCLGEIPAGIDVLDMNQLASILDEDARQEPPAEAVDLDPGDPAAILFTSGTTGEPKGVLYAQRYLAGQGLQAEHWFGARRDELAWCTAAPGWAKSTRNVFVAPWLMGAAAMLHDGRFDPVERLELIEREGVNVLCQAPTEYRMMQKRAELRPIPSLRRMVSAGEALNPEVIDAFRKQVGVPIHDGFGQTETGAIAGMRPGQDDPSKDGSMGPPLPGIEVRVQGAADDDPGGEEATVGELQVRPGSIPSFFDRYLGEEPFRGEWWPTGDLVRQDPDGYLWFESRDDDIIVSAGYRIGPFEVESALLSHPAVAEAAAVPAPDPERGSVVRAIVVLRAGEGSDALATELQEHVKSVTAPYKYPRIVDFAEELPKTSNGKIRRAALRRGT